MGTSRRNDLAPSLNQQCSAHLTRRALLAGVAGAGLIGGAVRAQDVVRRDLVYSEAGGVKLLMDIYLPWQPGPRPAVLLVHGGGWLGGSKAGYREIGPMLARKGYAACAINYRLAPDHPYPAAMDDCHRAIRWLRAHGPEFGIDPKRIAAMGDSAGGHLVALIGVRDARPGVDKELGHYRSRPDAVVSNYGAHELFLMWKIEMAHRPLTAWLGGPPDRFAENYRMASPVFMVDKKTPPMLLIHGDKDTVNPL